jgi:hypothetical protein
MNALIEQYLRQIKAQGQSSPAGMHWNDFFNFLCSKQKPGQKKPPVPFILAASGESNASKHRRLAEQLVWAEAAGCIDEALACLGAIPIENWNTGSPERWNKESY